MWENENDVLWLRARLNQQRTSVVSHGVTRVRARSLEDLWFHETSSVSGLTAPVLCVLRPISSSPRSGVSQNRWQTEICETSGLANLKPRRTVTPAP